jgi:uncharacterized delta-60 repeat protein
MSLRRRTASVLAVFIAAALVLPAGAAAGSPMPPPPVGALPEPLPEYQGQGECSATAKPGVTAFKQLLLQRYPGSRNLGIVRACHLGARSEHKEGRAFDWGVRVDRPREAGYARDLIGWLLATDADGVRYANARRVGVMYMIWNRKIWSANRAAEGWRTYSGPNPHTDHIHFSFTWPAAYKLTSYWTGKTYGAGSGGGAVDQRFGTNGWTAHSGANSVRLVTQLQREELPLLSVGQTNAGDALVLAGVSEAGDPAPAFAGPNRVRVPLPDGAELSAATLLSNGGVVVAGTVPSPVDPPDADPEVPVTPQRDLLLLRLTRAGALDREFGVDGVAKLDLGGVDSASAVRPTPGGGVIVAGHTVVDGVTMLAAARLLESGAPDPAFGSAGVVRTTASGVVAGTSVLVLETGRYLIGCRTATAGCLVRLTARGLLDAEFATQGVVKHPTMTDITAVIPAPGARLLAAGRGPDGKAVVARLKQAGWRDTAFGKSGFGFIKVNGCTAQPTGLVVRWDGRPVVSGRLTGCASGAFVGRFLPDGTLDPLWGNNGVGLIGARQTTPGALLLQPDGHIVLPATLGSVPETDMSAVRLTTVGPLPGRMDAARSAASTVYGTPVTIIGMARSTADNKGVAGQPVSFYARRAGAATWTKIGTATTDASGRARFKHAPTAQTSYKARGAVTTRLFATMSGTVAVSVRSRLTAAAGLPLVRRGTPVVLSVTAAPATPGRRIVLQRWVGGKWQTLRTPTLGATSVARVRLISPGKLTRQYRWVLPSGGGRLPGYSRTVTVQWR